MNRRKKSLYLRNVALRRGRRPSGAVGNFIRGLLNKVSSIIKPRG